MWSSLVIISEVGSFDEGEMALLNLRDEQEVIITSVNPFESSSNRAYTPVETRRNLIPLFACVDNAELIEHDGVEDVELSISGKSMRCTITLSNCDFGQFSVAHWSLFPLQNLFGRSGVLIPG